MAKGLRSHIKQKHKTKLRNTVFAPVIDARTERLSKKLQEIAAQPREAVMEDVNVVDGRDTEESKSKDPSAEAMELDEQDKSQEQSSSSSTTRIHKRHRKKAARKAINFKPHPMKAKAKAAKSGSKRK